MSNKQKNKSFENRQEQSRQNLNQTHNNRQEIPEYGSKSQNQKPEMKKDCHGGHC